MWMCCALAEHRDSAVLVTSVYNSGEAMCSLGQQCKKFSYGNCSLVFAVINAFTLYSPNFVY